MTAYEPAAGVVYVIDDDRAIREALGRLLRSVGLEPVLLETPAELAERRREVESCLILDVRLRGISGLEVQAKLVALADGLPVIMITGYGDIPMSVQAMKAGAVDFLTKPFRDQDLLDAVAAALERDRLRRSDMEKVRGIKDRLATLTPRERDISAMVMSGLLSKQIAAKLGLSEITVKVHRSNMMRKMNARSVAQLIQFASVLEGGPDRERNSIV